jgi:GntR family transcriptional regulator, glc operon transcriptional activator
VTGRLPEQARRAASAHIRRVRVSRVEIEQDEQRLIRSTPRLEGWNQGLFFFSSIRDFAA